MASSESIRTRVYAPGMSRGWGPSVWREMFREQAAAKELTWRLFLRDFSARYRQSMLGFLWAAVLPLVQVATFVLLKQSGVIQSGETTVPYVVFVLSGLAFWQIFAGGIAACSNAIVAGGSMVVKINFPKETLVVSAMGQIVVEFVVRLALVAVCLAIYRVQPSWLAIAVPFATIPLWLLTIGIGFLLAFANAVVRDVGNIVIVLTTFLLFLTPVVYQPPKSGSLAEIIRLNPLSVLVGAPRQLLFEGRIDDPARFAVVSAASLILFLFSWRVFHLVEARVAERI